MLSRRTALALAAVALAAPALALQPAAFAQKDFDAALKSGQPVLVEIHADWCPTCKAQKPILEKLTAEPRFSKLKVFRVDFDSQKDAVKAMKATKQSTLIVYARGAEVGRSVGSTDPKAIDDLLAKAL